MILVIHNSQVQASVSAGGSYGGYSGSFSLDINKFNEQVSQSAEFGSNERTIASGARIVKEGDHYRIAADNTAAPIPISVRLVALSDAFDAHLWTATPEGIAYSSLNIGQKLENFERAISEYPASSNAIAGSSKSLMHWQC